MKGYGSVQIIKNYGSGSGRPKNTKIRIRSTGFNHYILSKRGGGGRWTPRIKIGVTWPWLESPFLSASSASMAEKSS